MFACFWKKVSKESESDIRNSVLLICFDHEVINVLQNFS